MYSQAQACPWKLEIPCSLMNSAKHVVQVFSSKRVAEKSKNALSSRVSTSVRGQGRMT